MTITVNIEKSGDWERLTYVGPIDEDTNLHLKPVLEHLGPRVIINLSRVSAINSLGIRAWIYLLRDLEKGRTIVFEECAPVFVSQINMIPDMRNSARIQSVYGSYICEKCETQELHLFVEGQNLPLTANDEVAPPRCKTCHADMVMEEEEEEFFAWIGKS